MDETKFDTMRLIQNAESSDLYSLEDIMQEFGASEQPTVQGSDPEAFQTESGEEKSEAPAVQPEEKEADAPEYETQSESQIADAITAAVASSLKQEDRVAAMAEGMAVYSPQEGSDAQTDYESALEQEMMQPLEEDMPENVPEESQPEPVEQTEAGKTPQSQQESGRAQGAAKSQRQKNLKKHNSAKKQGTPRKQSEPAKPGTNTVKIKKDHIRTSPVQYLGMMLSDLHERQNAALPKNGISLRSRQKRISTMVSVEGVLRPMRYIVGILMTFALLGRRFQWMLLGFLGGTTGITVALVLTVFALAISFRSVYRGLRDAFYFQPSYETHLLVCTILTMLEAYCYKNTETLLPFLALSWCVCGAAEAMELRANGRMLRTLITGRSRVGVRIAPKKWEGTECIGKAPTSTSGFVRSQARPDIWHTGNTILFPLLFVIVLVVSAYLSAKTQKSFLTILVLLLDVGMPVSMALCCGRPYELLSYALVGRGVVSGWGGMRLLSGKKAMLIYDSDLFPKGMIGNKGVKVYGSFSPQLLVSFAASLIFRANVGLDEVFAKLLREMNGEIYEVTNYQLMEGGAQGYIQNVRVMVGSYQFMQLMGVVLPQRAKKNHLYVSINGEMAGVVAVNYRIQNGAVGAFRSVVKEPRLTPLIATRSFNVNPAYVELQFKAPVAQLACPKSDTRRILSQPSYVKQGAVCGYVLRDGIVSYSRVVACGRRVYRMGLLCTLISALLTCVLTVRSIMAISAGSGFISIPRLLILQLILLITVEVGARLAIRK